LRQEQAAKEWVNDCCNATLTVDLAALQFQEEELDRTENTWKEDEKSFDEIRLWGREILVGKSAFL
jgi:hypothetical protein